MNDSLGLIRELGRIWRWCWGYRRQIFIFVPVFWIALYSAVFIAGAKYQSDGFLRAGRKLTEYNAQRSAFADRIALSRFLNSQKLADDPGGQYLVSVLQESFLNKHVQIVLPYSKADLKYIADSKNAIAPDILGFMISAAAPTPAAAASRVGILGDFIKDTMLHEDLMEIVHAKAAEFKAKKQKIDNQLILQRLELDEATDKLNALKVIAAKYPEASRLGSRQLLSSDAGSEKFLSPVTQLVGVESVIADLRGVLASLERDAVQNALRETFFSRAEVLDSPPKPGGELLAGYLALQKDVFEGMTLEDDSIREVFNDIGLIAEGLRTKHLINVRFVSGPSVPDRRIGPGLFALSTLSLLGACLMTGLGLLAMDVIRQARRVAP